MEVRRALPSVKRQMVGPFIFFDQMGPAEFLTDQGIDVRPDPHINLAAVTYLFEGQMRYIWWNFVSSRPERIEQAKEEWTRGCFDTIPGDAEEFIPLPERQEKSRRATGGVFYP
jgi:redox-sensitive bicupin YhaK (pirin superfamily)